MKKENILKKSKKYYVSVSLLILFIVIFLTLLIISIISLLNIIQLRDALIKFIFAFMGFLLPFIGKDIDSLKSSLPWEAELNFLKAKGEIKNSDYIRISYASFFIIEVENEYLLLKNGHGMKLYLMPGATYPLSFEEESYLKENFHIAKDSFIKNKFSDYRLLVPVKELKRFYKRFCQSVNPYNSRNNYVMENTINLCNLNKKVFENYETYFKGRYIKKIEYSRYTGHFEMILGDVYEVNLTEDQKKELLRIKSIQSDNYKFATIEEIKANGINTSKNDLVADIATNAYDCFDSRILFK